jgi:spore maturation protein CgeB
MRNESLRFVLFYHSLVSCWNHGNAHFLRGIVTELMAQGHQVSVYEPRGGWSLQNLVDEHGDEPLARFQQTFPNLEPTFYDPATLDLNRALGGADVVLVHEWSDPELVQRIGTHRARAGGYRLFFHDTHHRAVTAREQMANYDLRDYDGVLAYGGVIRDLYLSEAWAKRAWTWHEAADVRLFEPIAGAECEGDLVWIGNWGDEERTAELHEFLFEPVRALGLRARVHGVRYPEHGREALARAGIEYAGWLANYEVPAVFSRFRVTVHIPRRPYVRVLPGIPTIRPFEALACGIPLVSAPWQDVEGLFTAGKDFLIARNGDEMKRHLRAILEDAGLAQSLAEHGRRTILERHTCAHRVNELLAIYQELEALEPRKAPVI